MKLLPAVFVALSGFGSLALADSAVAQTVVMSGLDNPRGLAFAPNGALYVTEAGRGGDGPCLVNDNTGETRCFGKSGAITPVAELEPVNIAAKEEYDELEQRQKKTTCPSTPTPTTQVPNCALIAQIAGPPVIHRAGAETRSTFQHRT